MCKEESPEVDRDHKEQQHDRNDKGELDEPLAARAMTMTHFVSP
jgi:hypothetical protein